MTIPFDSSLSSPRPAINSHAKSLCVVATLVALPLAAFSLGIPYAAVISLFLTVVGLWVTEILPLPVTGLLVPLLAVLYGLLPAREAFQAFGDEILFLFLGCFLLARSMEKYGFDRRLAYLLLARCLPGESFMCLNATVAFGSFFLSMWISNTSATAIFTTIAVGVLATLKSEFASEAVRKKASTRLLLSCAFGASIGGLATPIGSPPNLIAIKLLAQHGIQVSFLEWLSFGLPMAGALFLIMLLIVGWSFPLPRLSFPGVKEKFRVLLSELGPMNGGEKQVAVIFSCTVLGWILPGILIAAFPGVPALVLVQNRLSMSVVGLLGGVSAFFLSVTTPDKPVPHLSWAEAQGVDWGTLMMFGGGLTLARILDESGAAQALGETLVAAQLPSPFWLAAILVVTSIVLSEFASNTAASALLLPLVIGASQAQGLGEDLTRYLVYAAATAASLGFMLPVSTPPNAIVYGTGLVSARDMRKAGLLLDFLGALTVLAVLH